MPAVTPGRLALFAALSCLGCGASSGTRPVTDDDVRAVQIAEARQEEAFPEATSPDAECSASCGAAARVCEERRTVCARARETEDLDLRARCEDATDKCARAATAAESRCPCAVNEG
jgi:hypothetical protein